MSAPLSCTGAPSLPEIRETWGVWGERRGWDLLAAYSSHLFPLPQAREKWRQTPSGTHKAVSPNQSGNPSRSPKAQQSAKGTRPKGRREAHATACLTAWRAACAWVDKRLTGYSSVAAVLCHSMEGAGAAVLVRTHAWDTRALGYISRLRHSTA